MIKIDAGDFFLIEPSEEYSEQIAEYKQAFLDTNSSMDGCGPLRKSENPTLYIAECKKSMEAAKKFFAQYFPDFKYKVFTCHSWLIDEDLKEFLPENSNIVKFGDMFYRAKNYDSNALLRYIFHWDTNEINLRYAYSSSAFAEKIKAAVLKGRVFHETLGIIKA